MADANSCLLDRHAVKKSVHGCNTYAPVLLRARMAANYSVIAMYTLYYSVPVKQTIISVNL